MKQFLHQLKNGKTQLLEVPCPSVQAGHLLIQTQISLISSGTERMLTAFGKANVFQKALQQPEKVKQVLNKMKTEGIFNTWQAVNSRLDQVMPMGYANVGRVLAVGQGVVGFSVGDRVVSNGPHAEVVCRPLHLCAPIPDQVTDEAAAFTVLASIGLQGVRLAMPTLGETFVVMGLGVIGLLTVQLLRANGCQVVAMDYAAERLALAQQLGARCIDLSASPNPVPPVQALMQGQGVDGVIITAATQSDGPVHYAAQLCRQRGRIILVGISGLNLQRADFYEKELTFQVSCSYGPGRYDPHYEEQGHDYPLGFVRWTEQRNFSAILDLFANGQLKAEPLISHRFTFEEIEQAFQLLNSTQASLGIILQYPQKETTALTLTEVALKSNESSSATSRINQPIVGLIGAGNYASRTLMPTLKLLSGQRQIYLKTVVTQNGINSTHYGKKFGFETASTNTDGLFADPTMNSVIITTRHDTHANLVEQALKANKQVFVEKPLCINMDELERLKQILDEYPHPLLMVGFNRRFAPHILRIKQLLGQGDRAPQSWVVQVNAGAIPKQHWTQDKQIGGGRIIGEVCHFIDLLRYLVAAPITHAHAEVMDSVHHDTITITLKFMDGSIGTIHYFANGHPSLEKERLELFSNGRILRLNNFQTLTGYGWPAFKKMRLWRPDKGHAACLKAFFQAITQGGAWPIPREELIEVMQVTLDIDSQVQ